VGLIDVIGDGPVAVDTAIFTDFVEQHSRYIETVRPLFASADRGHVQLVTSAITLLELLVVPYRAGDDALAERYELRLTRSRGVTTVALDLGQLRSAAQLRANFGVRTPDSLQLAAARTAGCSAFITNDRRLPKLPGLQIVQLHDVA
jgi:predicted nucleic acid-binding protein